MTSRLPAAEFRARLAEARRRSSASGLDALLVTPGPDLTYLTGYDAPALERLTCLVVPADSTVPVSLVVPRLEQPAAEAAGISDLEVELCSWDETDDPFALTARVVGDPARVGLDEHMWAGKVLRLAEAMPSTQQALAQPVLGAMREIKSPTEVQALREAGEAIDRVHARMSEWLRVGRTERDVARDIAEAIIDEGHVRVDFVIVASGPNGASPHHEVSDRGIGAGDVVVVDIGGTTAKGYCSDCTRTYAMGSPSEEALAAYEVLQDAQAQAVASVAIGVTAESVDAAAREPITAAGYGDQFVHRTGHGIGLQTHEEPYIVAGNTVVIEAGMAFSVEPGIYLPGRFGARIEDIVVATDSGVEPLNTRPHHLAVL